MRQKSLVRANMRFLYGEVQRDFFVCGLHHHHRSNFTFLSQFFLINFVRVMGVFKIITNESLVDMFWVIE